jgi:photosystem II stability/assembly factor-like uncharacterized protein
LVADYFGIGHESLDNYIAEVSGQAPNPDTQGDCLAPADFTPGIVDAPQGQAIGQGCTYPARVKTIADQLQAKGLSWKGYEEDMGRNLAKDTSVDCSLSNNAQVGQTPIDNYVAKHNNFVWFHSIIDNRAYCDAHVVPLTGLRRDLQRIDTTPNLAFIAPNMADDGHDTAESVASGWAAYWVRQIMASPAYRQDGMIAIIFDENGDANSFGAPIDSQINSCCGEIPGPNSPSPGAFGSQGGGQTGAWILTPYGKPGTLTSTNSYNHYSLLRSLEDIFGITSGGADGQGHLGYAAGDGAPNSVVGFRSLGCDDIFTISCPPMAGQVPAPAQPNPSTNVGPRAPDGSAHWLNPAPQGDDLNGISCATATTCVAVGATGTIVSTGDGGSSWTSRSSATSADLNGVSCPAQSQLCVAVGAGGAILTSGDGGQTWSAQNSGTQRDLSGVSCPLVTTCYAVGAAGTIVHATDGGASWSAQNSPTTQDLAGIACPGANTCYVTGAFESNQLQHPDLVATNDGGSSWSIETNAQIYQARYRGIACADLKDCVVSDEGGSYYSTSDGFQSISHESGAFGRFGFVFGRLLGAGCVPGGGTCVLVGDLGLIGRDTNGTLSNQPNVPSGVDLSSVSCPSASACYAVGRGGVIMRSADSGASWTRSGADAAASNLSTRRGSLAGGGTTIGSLDLASTSCPTATACVAVGALGAILTTGDAGSSWSARGGLGAPGSDPFNLPIAQNGNGLYAPASIPETPDAHPLDAVSCASTSSCVAVGELGKVMTTSNLNSGGGNWSPHSSNTANRLTGVSCPKGSTACFAVGDYGTILKSTDGGSSWTSQGSGTLTFLNGISCWDTSDCLVVGAQGLILTTHDGSTWAPTSTPTSAYLSAVSCASTSSCLAVGGDGTVLASGNDGRSWTLQSAPSGDDLDAVSCATNRDCVVSGSNGTVASTADGGRRWAIQGTGTSDGLRGLSCPAQSTCYAAGDTGSILQITPTAVPGGGEGGGGGGGPGPIVSGLGERAVGLGLNNYRPRPAARARCGHVHAPASRIRRRSLRASRGRLSFSGRSRAYRCPARAAHAVANRITRVDVAVAKLERRRCRLLTRRGRLTRPRSCRHPAFLSVKLHAAGLSAAWSFSSPSPLRPGIYRILARSQDRWGNIERARQAVNVRLR